MAKNTPSVPTVPAAPDIAKMARIWNSTAKVLSLPPVRDLGLDVRDLLPGGNTVPVAHLEALANNGGVREWFACGWLEGRDGGELEPEGPPPPYNLSAYREDGAKALIEAETDRRALARWAQNDLRAGVAAAAKARLEALGG